MFAQPTEVNLERHERPSRRFLLATGEIYQLAQRMQEAVPAAEIVECTEAWRANGAHEANLVVRVVG